MSGGRFQWTPELLEEAIRRARDETAQSIATSFGTTRSSVLGKLMRSGVSLRKQPGTPKPRAPKPARPAPPPTVPAPPPPKPVEPLIDAETGLPAPAQSAAPIEDRSGALAAIADIRPGECRWPFGDPTGDFRFCCAPIAGPERPYCKVHTATAKGAIFGGGTKPFPRDGPFPIRAR